MKFSDRIFKLSLTNTKDFVYFQFKYDFDSFSTIKIIFESDENKLPQQFNPIVKWENKKHVKSRKSLEILWKNNLASECRFWTLFLN